MRNIMVWSFAGILSLASVAFADPGHGPGPCKQIIRACRQAKFTKRTWKQGTGLWRDCINPIAQKVTDVPGIKLTLPTVDSGVVDACKQAHPKFGSGKIGSSS